MKKEKMTVTRRQFLGASVATGVVLASDGLAGQRPRDRRGKAKRPARKPSPTHTGPYNILFILNDQERYMDRKEIHRLKMTGHEWLRKNGLTFTNHQVCSCVCSPSRSTIYTGTHIQTTKIFDNIELKWVESMDPSLPTVGDMMQDVGYYPAYEGKFHLSTDFHTTDEYAVPSQELADEMETYGFHDYIGIGDVVGDRQGGYFNDHLTAAQGARWLRARATQLKKKYDQPWFLAVNLVNPHDIMYYDTDLEDGGAQETPTPLSLLAREPDNEIYQEQNRVKLPQTLYDSVDMPGRPAAHKEYQLANDALVGAIPEEDDRWTRYNNYYLNSMRDADVGINMLLDELEDQDLLDQTIIVFAADHGELGGAHSLRGKGGCAYQESNNVPLIVSHPGYPKTHGQECEAITSHLDLAPSFLSWTGQAEKAESYSLKGEDITPLLPLGKKASLNEIRDATLFCYNQYSTNDGNYFTTKRDLLNDGMPLEKVSEKLCELGLPSLSKRGAIRSIFDGRHKYSRYFSPLEFNNPKTVDEILAKNDVELFDLKEDPEETKNLILELDTSDDSDQISELLLAMNEKMNAIIAEEVGVDDGSFLPKRPSDALDLPNDHEHFPYL